MLVGKRKVKEKKTRVFFSSFILAGKCFLISKRKSKHLTEDASLFPNLPPPLRFCAIVSEAADLSFFSAAVACSGLGDLLRPHLTYDDEGGGDSGGTGGGGGGGGIVSPLAQKLGPRESEVVEEEKKGRAES